MLVHNLIQLKNKRMDLPKVKEIIQTMLHSISSSLCSIYSKMNNSIIIIIHLENTINRNDTKRHFYDT